MPKTLPDVLVPLSQLHMPPFQHRQSSLIPVYQITDIEKKTFEMMVASFNALAEKVAALRRRSDGGRMERWLTGEEVCGQLRISPRTLQTLRDRRLIGYSQINRRFYYKPEEVKRLIPLVGTLYPGGK